MSNFSRSNAHGKGHNACSTWICIGGAVITIIAFYPGFMSPDSTEQFAQSVAFSFTDWHPPIMAFLWSLLNTIYPGPQLMLVLQATIYWSTAWLTVNSNRSNEFRCGLLIFFLLPPMISLLGVIWKDIQLALAWSCAIAIVHYFRSHYGRETFTCRFWAVALVLYGCLVRHNAFLGIPPLLFYIFRGTPFLRNPWHTAAAYLIVAVLAFAALPITNKYIFRAKETTVSAFLVATDLAGITFETGKSSLPFPLSDQEVQEIVRCRDPYNMYWQYIFGECKFVYERLTKTYSKSELYLIWLKAIVRHPIGYAVHRLRLFGNFLCIYKCSHMQEAWFDGNWHPSQEFKPRPNAFFYILDGYTNTIFPNALFWPISWLIITFSVLSAALWFRIQAAVALCVASILYALTFAPLVMSNGYRYYYASVVMCVQAIVIILNDPSVLVFYKKTLPRRIWG